MKREQLFKLVKKFTPCRDGLERLMASKGTVRCMLREYHETSMLRSMVYNGTKAGDYRWLRNHVYYWANYEPVLKGARQYNDLTRAARKLQAEFAAAKVPGWG